MAENNKYPAGERSFRSSRPPYRACPAEKNNPWKRNRVVQAGVIAAPPSHGAPSPSPLLAEVGADLATWFGFIYLSILARPLRSAN
ncbi:hypothetical protein VTN96DRAFT_9627 [Rasamsonia emersonii]